ncbi:hypothetical protein ACFOLK_17355 [Marinococcus halophilus]
MRCPSRTEPEEAKIAGSVQELFDVDANPVCHFVEPVFQRIR